MTTLAPGAVFARDYTIVRPLSEGGMGAIYVVQQISTGAQRALKLMHQELVREPRLRQRFEQEARIGSRIESEHVVQVLAAGIDEPSGMPFLIMELLNGQDLSALLEKRGALPPAEVRDIFAQLTHAIAAAHRVGVVHRDLKPENVFIAVARREGMTHFVKVLDFGIAKVAAEAKSTATQALGTPMWMAPEQTERSRAMTPAADVWALGLIAFKMLTGKFFWISANNEDSNYTMVLREAVFEPIPSASARAQELGVAHLLPPGFDAWFARCVARDPAARFENAGLAREAFAEVIGRASSVPSAPQTIAGAPASNIPAATPTGAPTPAGYTPVPAHTPAGPMLVGGAQTQPVMPHLPVAPAAPARSSGSGKGIWIAAAAVLVIGGLGFGVRAMSRAQKIKACEQGEGDGRLDACKVACSADPKKFCVTYGDLSRTALDTASLEEARKSYEKACNAADFLGCRKLGSIQEIDGDDGAALLSYQKSCDGKDASGCAWLGTRLESGRGIARDAAKASSYYEKACSGDDPASCALQAFASENRPIPRPDAAELDALYKKATPALQKECSSGGLWECMALGHLLQHGKGIDRDINAASTMYQKACKGGVRAGCNNASALALVGPEAGKAADGFRETCTAGVQAACNNLAVLQAGVPFTLRQAQGVSVLKVACSKAVPLGCTQNGASIPPAAGMPMDLAASVAALEKACSAGLGVACANLGAFQESGLQAALDPAKALSSYEKACAAGAPEGCAGMKESPFKAGESWTGTYTCGQGATDMTLRILDASADQKVTAIFDFDYDHGKVPGRFLISGAYDASRGSDHVLPRNLAGAAAQLGDRRHERHGVAAKDHLLRQDRQPELRRLPPGAADLRHGRAEVRDRIPLRRGTRLRADSPARPDGPRRLDGQGHRVDGIDLAHDRHHPIPGERPLRPGELSQPELHGRLVLPQVVGREEAPRPRDHHHRSDPLRLDGLHRADGLRRRADRRVALVEPHPQGRLDRAPLALGGALTAPGR
ncbi:MAG: protein kinase [Minicystis sp.]